MPESWIQRIGSAWRESAPFWSKHRGVVREMFGPITREMLSAAAVERADMVLDVAGGPGEPALSLAKAVGLAGRVVHTDLAMDMAKGAESEAAARGLANISFALASGDRLPFRDEVFDRVFCRFGLMFLPDAECGASEMLRVTRHGGSIVLAVWGRKDANPFFTVPAEIAARYAPSPDDPDAPDVWRFGATGFVAEILARSGATDVVEKLVSFEIAAQLDFDRFWAVRVDLSDTLRARVSTLDAEDRRQLADDVRHATLRYFDDGSMRIPAEALVVTARKA